MAYPHLAAALPHALILALAGGAAAQTFTPVQPLLLETAQPLFSASGENNGPDIGIEGGPRAIPACAPSFGTEPRQVGAATNDAERDTVAYAVTGEACAGPR